MDMEQRDVVPLMKEFREIETWLECSAKSLAQVQVSMLN
jgi:hypothetical protein